MKKETLNLIPGTLPSPDELFHASLPDRAQTDTSLASQKLKSGPQIPKYRLEGRARYLFLLVPLTIVIIFLSHESLGFGFYCMTSSSMESTIPKGSLLFDRQVPPGELETHDIITFETGDGACVTHEIVGICPNYNGTGNTAFRTKGTDNALVDRNVIMEEQIVGKVMFHVPKAGALLYGFNDWDKQRVD